MISTITIDNDSIAFYNEIGYFHRINGPAIIENNKCQEWRFNGYPHRINGPAMSCKNGSEAWYIHGIKIKYLVKSQ